MGDYAGGAYTEEVEAYVAGILDGTKAACPELKQAAARYRADIASGRWTVDTDEADFVIRTIQKTFTHRQGETMDGTPLRGKPLLLEPWQKFIVYGILIFYLPGTRERRIKEAFIFVPRKNGKTMFIAALAWALALLSAKSGAVIYIAAAALKQAMQAWDDIAHNLCNHLYKGKKQAQEDGWRILDNNMSHSISCDSINGGSVKIEALAANPDAQDSFNANIAILDELHALKSAKHYNVIREATKAYTNKLVIGITTAGDNPNSFCYRRLTLCRQILEDTVADAYADSLFIFICCAEKDENGDVDYTNPYQHEIANPNYGVTIRPAEILAQSLEAQNDPGQRKDFLAKQLDVYTSSIRAYFNVDEFRLSDSRYDWTLEQLAKLPVKWYGGTDLSKLHDLTAAALYGTYKGTDIIITHAWFPVTEAVRKADEDNIPLFGWKDDGWLTMSNDKVVNHAEIVQWYRDMKARGFNIVQVGHDRKFCREYFVAMKRAGFRIVDQPQYFYRKSEGFRHIEKKAKSGDLYYMHSKAFEYCVSNVHAVEKTDDMVMYEKVDPQTRIDIFDAAVFAAVRMLDNMERSSSEQKWIGKDGKEESESE